MSHRARVRLANVLPLILILASVAAHSAEIEPIVNDRLADRAEITVRIFRSDRGIEIDVHPRTTPACPEVRPDCSNFVRWTLINESGDPLGENDLVELVYKPIPPEPFIPRVFTEQPEDGHLPFPPGGDPIERMVRPDSDWVNHLGNPKIAVWRYEARLVRDGEVVAKIDPRVIIDRTR